jgi:glycosyltransferase involved in cell wall biosynthesis
VTRIPVALDATYSIGEGLTGVGLYSQEILHGLAAAHPEMRFHFYYRPHRFLRSWRVALPHNVRRRLLAEPIAPRGAELFHGLNQRLPQMKLRRAVTTFHDLFVLTGDYSTPEFRARFAAQARDAARRSDAIIAVSNFTRNQVVELLGVDPARVRVVHHGIRRLPLPDVLREKVILNVGAIQKRKNIVRLVEAFEAVDTEWWLVLAGSDGYGAGSIRAAIEKSPARDRIAMLGYLPEEELAAWYSRATVFAFPSVDEGFGMPVLEAMAAGAAVVTSNRSALPEVAGDAALLVDPEDAAALAGALRRVTTDEVLREELVRRGRNRLSLFSWDQAVAQTWALYRDLLPK